MNIVYQIDSNNNIQNICSTANQENLDEIKAMYDYPNGCFVSTIDIRKETGYAGQIDEYGNLLYKMFNGDPVLRSANDHLVNYKTNFKEKITTRSFRERKDLIPDWKLINAIIGQYDDQTKADYGETVSVFRVESSRVQDLIDAASNLDQIKLIHDNEPNFPTTIQTGTI